MVVCTLPAQIWLDRWGRRRPLIIGGLAMAFSFLTIGAIFAGLGKFENGAPMLPDKAAQWTVVILIYFFIANFSWSWASVSPIRCTLPFDEITNLHTGHSGLCQRDCSDEATCQGLCPRAAGQLGREFCHRFYHAFLPPLFPQRTLLPVRCSHLSSRHRVYLHPGDQGAESRGH